MGKDAFDHRFVRRSGSDDLSDLGILDRGEIEGLGILKIVMVAAPTEVIPGGYMTGFVWQVSGYEQVPPIFLLERKGSLEQDVFEGEQAMVFVVKGKGPCGSFRMRPQRHHKHRAVRSADGGYRSSPRGDRRLSPYQCGTGDHRGNGC